MNETFVERMGDRKVRHDTKLLGDFADIYCGELHPDRPRARLASDGATLGVYGRRLPVVCEDCAELLRYSEKRRAYCPKDPKPFCAACDTHCYKPDMRHYMQEVMRYSGRRSWKRGYAVDGVKHVIEMRRFKARQRREAEAAAADAPGGE